MKQTKRNNHIVPASYLRSWSRNGNTVQCYDTIARNIGQGIWRSSSIKHAAYWRDFYSQHDNEGIDDSIEEYLNDSFENDAAGVLKRLWQDKPLNDDDKAILVRFAILQMVRTPAWFAKSNEVTRTVFPQAMEETVSGVIADIDAGRIDRVRQYDDYEALHTKSPFPSTPLETHLDETESQIVSTITLGRENYLASIGNVLNGNVGALMKSYEWAIIRTPEGFELPTSDNPFVRLAYNNDYDYGLDAGIGAKGSDLFMPLTPHHLLITEIGADAIRADLLESERYRKLIKKAIVENATRYIYCVEPDSEIIEMRPRVIDPDYCEWFDRIMQDWDLIQSGKKTQ